MNDDFVILMTADSSFEAHNVAAVLAENEIETRVLDSVDAEVPLEQAYSGVPVMVRAADLGEARAALSEGEIDWTEVDVGAREDDLPLRRAGRMPVLARVTFAVAVLVVLLVVVVGVAALLIAAL